MTDQNGHPTTSGDVGLEDMRMQLREMERYIKRRFDELSTEVNAASQLIGMSEESVKERFREVIELLNAISYRGDGRSRAQAGVELDAVVKITEDAANRILDAADRIGERLEDEATWSDASTRADALDKTRNDIQEILIACAFQDITGQRIQRALDNLQTIESRLEATLSKFGIDTGPFRESVEAHVEKGSEQAEIDRLFDS